MSRGGWIAAEIMQMISSKTGKEINIHPQVTLMRDAICSGCPFLKGNAYLNRSRVEGMKRELHDDDYATFRCHKTLDYSDNDGAETERTAICAGFINMAIKTGRWPIAMRLASIMGEFNPKEFKHQHLIWDDWQQMIDAQEN